jgi:transcriptional regulator with XRE-family HTH domain
MEPSESGSDRLALEIGRALRSVRRQRGWTLRDVADASHGEFRPTSVAGYERGERHVTLDRFIRLCEVYGVPPERVVLEIRRSADGRPVATVDLAALERLESPEGRLLSGFVRQIESLRSEPAGPTLTLRAGDLAVLATASGRTPEELLTSLEGTRPLDPTGEPRVDPST